MLISDGCESGGTIHVIGYAVCPSLKENAVGQLHYQRHTGLAVVLYPIPRTSVLGAILLTGYLGGATVTHLRVGDPAFIGPVIAGILVWGGLFFREPRVRALIPFRSPNTD